LVNKVWAVYEHITKADIQRVAQKYFTEPNRTVMTTLPKAATAPSGS